MYPSSSSDDTDESTMDKGEKYINTYKTTQNSNSKKKRLKTGSNQSITVNRLEPTFLKREQSAEDSSSSSEFASSSIKTFKQMMENVPSKSSKKLKKKRKKDIYHNNSSEEENVNMSVNSSEKANKKEKRKTLNNNDLLKEDRSVIKNEFNNESDYVTSDEAECTKKNSLEQIDAHAIKKEVLSDDILSSSSDSEPDPDRKSDGHAVTINKKVIENIKNEAGSSSDSEEDGKITSFHKSQTMQSVAANPVKILQDVRLIPKSNKSTKEKLLEMYPGINQIEITTEIDISEGEDIHLFRIPKNVDPNLLKRAEVSLEKECKVNLKEKYIIRPTTKVPDPTFVISASSRVLFFKNNIKMERYIKSKAEPNIEVPEKKLVPLPENLKKRHPLFGSDFIQKIKLSEQVEHKLDEAIANLLKRERKSKKKDKKNKKDDNVEKPEEIFDMFNSHNFLTFHDRVKKENSDDSAFGSSSSVDKPRGKKKEKHHVSDGSIEQEMELCTEKEPKQKRTDKKKKHSNDHSWIDVSQIKEEIQDSITDNEEVLISPKKKKKSSVINSTLMSDVSRTPQFNAEVSTIVSEPSSSGKKSMKSKKNKTHKQEDNIKEELISQLLDDATMKLHFSKNIKTEF